MSTVELAQIERVDPRTVWKDEARDFTPWLAANLELLGSALGLEVELTQTEGPVGPFSADIVGKDLSSGVPIVVENQLEATDHDHLGKLLTYASGIAAGAVVWVAREFREEHKQALTWLNEVTQEDTAFFGLEIELLRIDGSRPAPNLKVVAAPNEWQKAARAASKEAASELARRYQEFWRDVIPALLALDSRATTVSPDRAPTGNSFTIPIGRTGFSVNFVFSWPSTGRFVRVEFYIDTGDHDRNKAAFDALHADREAIEAEFGEELVWDRRDDIRASRIYVERPGSPEDSPELLQEFKAWGAERMIRLRNAFRPRIQALT